MSAGSFKFDLGDTVRITMSAERGEVIARTDYTRSESQYLVRYVGSDDRACEQWWAESALGVVP